MTDYIGKFRGVILLNLYLIELEKEEYVLGDFAEFLNDKDIMRKNFTTGTKGDLLSALRQYVGNIRNELLKDGLIEQVTESYDGPWSTPPKHRKFYEGLRLTNTGKMVASELKKARDGIKSKIGE
jgi:hypothetical protein